MFKKNRKKTLISPVLFADNNQVSQKIKRPGSSLVLCHQCGFWYDSNRAVCPNSGKHQGSYRLASDFQRKFLF